MISEFKGSYYFLSNFFPWTISVEGDTYKTVEHAYQALKTEDEAWRAKIRDAETPSIAKRLGRQAPMRANWNMVRIDIMRHLLEQKFEGGIMLRGLMDTRGSLLVEGNYWGDTFWGQCPVGNGENHLGKLLMEIRDRG